MARVINHYINGKIVSNDAANKNPVYNPATAQKIAEVAMGSTKEVSEAVVSAKEAYKSWSITSPLKRARILRQFLILLENNQDELINLVTSEHGKTLLDAKGELGRGMEIVEYALGVPELLKGEYTQQVATGVDSFSVRHSVGICAGITPFNFPLMVPLWMVPMALACGNCFILKPSERDPGASVLLARLLTEAGLPDGVFNVVHGGHDAVNAILQHPEIEAISFVGSTNIAKYVYEQSAKFGKRVQALGGAKNHLVVCPDANIEKTVDGIIGAAFGSAGQRCMAISVVVAIGDDVADAVTKELQTKLKDLKVGNGMDPDTDMGPVITKEQQTRILEMIDTGVEQGASLLVDGRDVAKQQEGFFIGATLFDHVTSDMQIYQEEIFGPVLCVMRVSSIADAKEMINEHKYGNGVSIYTQDGQIARDFCAEIKVGMVGVNVPIPVPMAFHSFGGWKQSCFGDITMHGPEGIRFNTKIKTVTTRWNDSKQNYMHFDLR